MGRRRRSAATVIRLFGIDMDFGRSESGIHQSCIYLLAVGDTALDKGATVRVTLEQVIQILEMRQELRPLYDCEAIRWKTTQTYHNFHNDNKTR